MTTGLAPCPGCGLTISCVCDVHTHELVWYGKATQDHVHFVDDFVPNKDQHYGFDGANTTLHGNVQFTEPVVARELLKILGRLGPDATIADLIKLLQTDLVEHELKHGEG